MIIVLKLGHREACESFCAETQKSVEIIILTRCEMRFQIIILMRIEIIILMTFKISIWRYSKSVFDEIQNHYFDEMITTKAKLYSALAKGNWVKTKLKIRFEENAFGDENAFWKQTKFITFFIKLTIHSPPHHYASLFCCLRYSPPLFWSSSSSHMKYQREKLVLILLCPLTVA